MTKLLEAMEALTHYLNAQELEELRDFISNKLEEIAQEELKQ